MENNIDENLNTSEDQEIEFFDFDENLQPKWNSSLNNTQAEVISLDDTTKKAESDVQKEAKKDVFDNVKVETLISSNDTVSRPSYKDVDMVPPQESIQSPFARTDFTQPFSNYSIGDVKIFPESMLICKSIIDNASAIISDISNSLRSVKVPYDDVSSIINNCMVIIDTVYDKLFDLSYKLGIDIISSLELGMDFKFDYGDLSELFLTEVEDFEIVKSSNYKTIGDYIIVTLKDGRKFVVGNQGWGYWASVKPTSADGVKRTRNLGGGCSLFALASILTLLSGDVSEEWFISILSSTGNFGGFEQLMSGNENIMKDGKKYTLETDASDKKSYGSSSNKEDVMEDWRTTLENGGCVYLNVSEMQYDFNVRDENGNITHTYSASEMFEKTHIESNGGHVIAMVGLTPDGKIIFADSIFDGRYTTSYDKGVTIEEFYDCYGGTSQTRDGDNSKYYYTVTDVNFVEVID